MTKYKIALIVERDCPDNMHVEDMIRLIQRSTGGVVTAIYPVKMEKET